MVNTKVLVMKLVECSKEYWEFVRELRNDIRVQDGFINPTFITEQMQKSYMSNYSRSYRVALVEDQPAGYVGVIDKDIRVCTHPDFQGKGVGKFMINECVKLWPDAVAKVKVENKASLKLFEACGFKKNYYLLSK